MGPEAQGETILQDIDLVQIPVTSGNSVKNNNLDWYCLVATIL
jgi:hypothetical protein